MSQPSDPHDKLFRALLDEPERAWALLQDHLPAAIVAEFADQPPLPVEGSFVDAALRGSQSDRLFQVALRDGRTAFVYTLLEHKSTPDPRTPIQLLTYMARIWDRHLAETGAPADRLPAIIPMVIYHGRRPWTVPTSVRDAIDATPTIRDAVAGFGYILRDLGPVPDAELARDRVLRAGLAALKHAFDRGVPLEIVVSILTDLPDQSLLEWQVLEYVVRVYDVSERDLAQAVAEAKPHRREELMGTVAEEWLQRGKAEGLAEGKAQGEAAGKAAMLLHMLERQFGPLPSWVPARVRQAADAERDAWANALFEARTLDEVFDAPPRP